MRRRLPGTSRSKIRRFLSESDSSVWDRIFIIRDGEQAGAPAELNQFVRLMSRPAEECTVRGVFDLIEEGAQVDLPACGRCPSCRAHGRGPPRALACHGLETAWPDPAECRRSRLPSGVTLIAPRDPTYETGFERLVRRLVASGIEQFVVPDPLTAQTANTLAETSAHFGFVLSHNEVLGEVVANLANLPTVLFLPVQDAAAASWTPIRWGLS